MELYLRVRGRVLGPYDEEKLKSLARRGQLSRMHEVSGDGASWERASNYPDLFHADPLPSGPAPAQAQTAVAAAESSGDGFQAAATQDAPPQSRGQQWHYASGGMERGPVDFSNLQLLAASGQLADEDLVWCEGMANWAPVSQVPGLKRGGGGREAAEVPGEVARAAVDSRSWALFVAIMFFIFGGLSAVWGVLWLMAGNTVAVAFGLFSLIYALVWVLGGYLLISYSNRLATFDYSKNAIPLAAALRALKGFWIYVSILLIVCVAFVISFLVWVLAAGIGLSRALSDFG